MTLYVTYLPATTLPDDLVRLFARYGPVAGAEIWVGRNGDLGLVAGAIDMPAGGDAAIAAVNGRKFWGRELTVGDSRPWDPT
jgi:hypothetical protein